MSTADMVVVEERPILFSGPMVKAILGGRKTQTRRVFALLPDRRYPDGYDTSKVTQIVPPTAHGSDKWTPIVPAGEWPTPQRCPYGMVSDHLWVREKLIRPDGYPWLYGADHLPVTVDKEDESAMLVWAHHKERDYCPSMFMPRWASRIDLEVTGVRVERVQDISEDDAEAEGAEQQFRTVIPIGGKPQGCTKAYSIPVSYRAGFANLWDKINAESGFGWDSNPWVWVVEFKKL